MELASVLKKPLITEKAMTRGEYVFGVDKKATKKDIKQAIEKIFGVKVVAVKTTRIKGGTRKLWRTSRRIKLGEWKKAIVRLAKEQKIDLFETGGKGEQK